ncbi:MAG: hypothetical protein WCO26_06610 [Deltaproteobacteria bacterium]
MNIRDYFSRFDSPPEHSKKVLQGNKKVLRYIKEKNLEKASYALRNHIQYAGKRIKSLSEQTEWRR